MATRRTGEPGAIFDARGSVATSWRSSRFGSEHGGGLAAFVPLPLRDRQVVPRRSTSISGQPLNRSLRRDGTVDLGLTYGLTDNIQLDAGVNIGLTASADDINPFLGLSLRF